ncbi:DUF1559 family PulG-like putative transporter [Adhaeretor mobilis]|uniref:DUF1559 domain-containing protein n=1 Tax=Adhaeretor mobilis TaxID=1930276 RepID=A0A517MRU4_9BACT|nr:DUF1559 domain-containing protein [Adhaeretor mobilis]QDS97600.1 hypothetical protein HG15A2_08630 [Adhaeretor mobilis]
MQFRLITIVYIFALLAAAMATFGVGWGICLAILTLSMHRLPLGKWFKANASPGPIEWLIILFALVVLLGPLSFFIPDLRPLSPSPRSVCNHNLKWLALTLHNYHDVHGRLPLPATAEGPGEPARSWRYEILPFMEGSVLAKNYDKQEAWDGPSNHRLALMEQYGHTCPADTTSPKGETSYFAVIGEETIWSEKNAKAFTAIPDGASMTILLIEASNRGINWFEPRDISIDEAIELMTTGAHAPHRPIREGFFTRNYATVGGRNAVFADGHVEFIPPFKEPAIARALLTAAGGEVLPENIEDYYLDSETITEIKWRNVYSLSVFLGLAVLPWIRRRWSRAA